MTNWDNDDNHPHFTDEETEENEVKWLIAGHTTFMWSQNLILSNNLISEHVCSITTLEAESILINDGRKLWKPEK